MMHVNWTFGLGLVNIELRWRVKMTRAVQGWSEHRIAMYFNDLQAY